MICSFEGNNCYIIPNNERIKELCGEELGKLLIQGMNADPTKRPDPTQMCDEIANIACQELERFDVSQSEDFINYMDSFDKSIKSKLDELSARIKNKKEVSKDDLMEIKEYQTKSILMGWNENLEKMEKFLKEIE